MKRPKLPSISLSERIYNSPIVRALVLSIGMSLVGIGCSAETPPEKPPKRKLYTKKSPLSKLDYHNFEVKEFEGNWAIGAQRPSRTKLPAGEGFAYIKDGKPYLYLNGQHTLIQGTPQGKTLLNIFIFPISENGPYKLGYTAGSDHIKFYNFDTTTLTISGESHTLQSLFETPVTPASSSMQLNWLNDVPHLEYRDTNNGVRLNTWTGEETTTFLPPQGVHDIWLSDFSHCHYTFAEWQTPSNKKFIIAGRKGEDDIGCDLDTSSNEFEEFGLGGLYNSFGLATDPQWLIDLNNNTHIARSPAFLPDAEMIIFEVQDTAESPIRLAYAALPDPVITTGTTDTGGDTTDTTTDGSDTGDNGTTTDGGGETVGTGGDTTDTTDDGGSTDGLDTGGTEGTDNGTTTDTGDDTTGTTDESGTGGDTEGKTTGTTDENGTTSGGESTSGEESTDGDSTDTTDGLDTTGTDDTGGSETSGTGGDEGTVDTGGDTTDDGSSTDGLDTTGGDTDNGTTADTGGDTEGETVGTSDEADTTGTGGDEGTSIDTGGGDTTDTTDDGSDGTDGLDTGGTEPGTTDEAGTGGTDGLDTGDTGDTGSTDTGTTTTGGDTPICIEDNFCDSENGENQANCPTDCAEDLPAIISLKTDGSAACDHLANSGKLRIKLGSALNKGYITNCSFDGDFEVIGELIEIEGQMTVTGEAPNGQKFNLRVEKAGNDSGHFAFSLSSGKAEHIEGTFGYVDTNGTPNFNLRYPITRENGNNSVIVMNPSGPMDLFMMRTSTGESPAETHYNGSLGAGKYVIISEFLQNEDGSLDDMPQVNLIVSPEKASKMLSFSAANGLEKHWDVPLLPEDEDLGSTGIDNDNIGETDINPPINGAEIHTQVPATENGGCSPTQKAPSQTPYGAPLVIAAIMALFAETRRRREEKQAA